MTGQLINRPPSEYTVVSKLLLWIQIARCLQVHSPISPIPPFPTYPSSATGNLRTHGPQREPFVPLPPRSRRAPLRHHLQLPRMAARRRAHREDAALRRMGPKHVPHLVEPQGLDPPPTLLAPSFPRCVSPFFRPFAGDGADRGLAFRPSVRVVEATRDHGVESDPS